LSHTHPPAPAATDACPLAVSCETSWQPAVGVMRSFEQATRAAMCCQRRWSRDRRDIRPCRLRCRTTWPSSGPPPASEDH
jgi:hypothetical protein